MKWFFFVTNLPIRNSKQFSISWQSFISSRYFPYFEQPDDLSLILKYFTTWLQWRLYETNSHFTSLLTSLTANLYLNFWHRSFTFNSNKSQTWCKHFSVYYPDVCLQLNMFRAFSRPSSRAQRLQWQPLVLPSYRGDSRTVFVVGPAGPTMNTAFHFVPACMQSTNLYDIYLMLCVQSWTPDDGRKDRTKHVDWYSINSKNCASSWFYHRNREMTVMSLTTRFQFIRLLPILVLFMYLNT